MGKTAYKTKRINWKRAAERVIKRKKKKGVAKPTHCCQLANRQGGPIRPCGEGMLMSMKWAVQKFEGAVKKKRTLQVDRRWSGPTRLPRHWGGKNVRQRNGGLWGATKMKKTLESY